MLRQVESGGEGHTFFEARDSVFIEPRAGLGTWFVLDKWSLSEDALVGCKEEDAMLGTPLHT